MKKKEKSRISNYNELLAIKRTLRKNIANQEESLSNDIFSLNHLYNTYVKVFISKKKGKKKLDNKNVLALNDMMTELINPLVKNSKHKDVYAPVLSLGISVLVVNLLNNSFQKNKSTSD